MADRRRLLLAAAWIATAVATGWLFSLLLRPRAEREIVYVERPDPVAVPRAHGTDARIAGPADIAPPAPTPSNLPPTGLLEPASIEVTVVAPEGGPPPDGVVYALGPGEPGANHEEQVCHAAFDSPGPAVLRVPGPGVYDIGFSCDRGTVLQSAVSVPAGSAARLALRLPGESPIILRCDPPRPPPGKDVQIEVNLDSADDLPEVKFPGRGQHGESRTKIPLGETGEGATSQLPSDRVYSIRPVVFEVLTNLEPYVGGVTVLRTADSGPAPPERIVSPRYRVEPDRETVRPGETVRFALRSSAVLDVRIEAEGFPSEETDVATWLEAFQGGARRLDIVHTSGRREVRRGACRFSLDAAPCTLRWSGRGIQAGAIENIPLRAGEIEEVVVRLRPDPDGRDPEGAHGTPAGPAEEHPVPLEVTGLPADFDGQVWAVGAYAAMPGGPADGRYREGLDGGPPFLLPERFRDAQSFWISVGDDLASDTTPVPASGPVTAALRPAGRLLVAPEEEFPAEFGSLTLRLPGGRIIRTSGDGDVFAAAATPGQILGPLPEGTYTFEVRLGAVRLPDATATVKAGRIEVLRVRTRRE